MKVCIVIPTYNESENIKSLITEILNVINDLKDDVHVLVADDNSPDGTAEIVKNVRSKKIHLLTGEKQGLGAAYLRAFKHVMYDYDAVMMMDADFSHPPDMIPKFISMLHEGYDFVIGSRYIKGGDAPDWTFNRRLVSFTGNFFARIVAGLYSVHDCTSGYRAIRTDLLKKIDFKDLHTRGYAFMSTLLFEALEKGAKTKEIPLVFYDRKLGNTKLRKKDMVEFITNSLRLRLKKSEKFLKFAFTGGIGTIVNLGVLYVLVGLFGIEKRIIAPSIALELSIISNFIMNYYWTFKDRKGSFIQKAVKFHAAALSGALLTLILYNVFLNFAQLHRIVGSYDYILSQFISIVIVLFWNYYINTRWTWKKEI